MLSDMIKFTLFHQEILNLYSILTLLVNGLLPFRGNMMHQTLKNLENSSREYFINKLLHILTYTVLRSKWFRNVRPLCREIVLLNQFIFK